MRDRDSPHDVVDRRDGSRERFPDRAAAMHWADLNNRAGHRVRADLPPGPSNGARYRVEPSAKP